MLDSGDRNPERAWLERTTAAFEQRNDALIPGTRGLLRRVVEDGRLHARLINTLSMLEHTGSRKIMGTQATPQIDQATLRHLTEEAHHAFFMKRQAEKTAGRALAFVADDLLAPATARMYFQRLEARIVGRLRDLGSLGAAYLYMSMIVEFRALWFYRIYQQTLTQAGHAMSLKRILGEEQSHLTDMAQRLESAGALDAAQASEFLAFEQTLYERLLAAMQRAIDQPCAAA